MSGKRNHKILVIKVVISAAFFYILFSFVQSNELLAVFTGINWPYFLLSFVMAFAMLLVSCMKWKVLLDASGRKVHFSWLLRTYFIGYFFSNLLPSTVGGDVVRSYYAGRLIDNQAYAAASVFLERFTGMLFLLVLVMTAPLLRPELYGSMFVVVPAMGAAFLLLIVFLLWKMKDPLSLPDRVLRGLFAALRQWVEKREIQRLQNLLGKVESLFEAVTIRLRTFKTELKTALAAIRRDRRIFFRIFILTFVFYFFTWLNVYISFLAFGVDPGFAAVSALVPTIMFVAQMPLTLLGNLGFFESVFVFYFLLLDIPAAESLAMGLLLRIKMLTLGVLGLLVYLSSRRGRDDRFTALDRLAD